MPREDEITAVQDALAVRYRLSRQTALMLALLVCLPQVTTTAIAARLGRVEAKSVVFRLRARLREADETVVIHARQTYGYYLDAPTRERLHGRDHSRRAVSQDRDAEPRN